MTESTTPTTPEEPDRQCIRCGALKPATEFHWTSGGQGIRYRRGQCGPCRAATRKRRRTEKKPEHRRRTNLKRRYKLTEEEYEKMLAEQGGECLGCRARPTVTGRKLYVDHDHACCPGPESCGECVRGLLCMVCNWVVGRVRDDAQTMERLASYLRAHVRT